MAFLKKFKSWLSAQMEKTPATHKIKKAIRILLRSGFGSLWVTFKNFVTIVILKKEVIVEEQNLQGYEPYDSEYQEDRDFPGASTDVKALAFYLPQYHAFPENDAWWGEGFTEWVNVRKGTPQFPGHYQPRVPHRDIGYYSLDDIEVLKRQAELAKRHGIYGFCFYYYWFSGKRLMEKPVDRLLEHPEIDLPFCLCWANENWTRTWDGQNENVLIRQEYSEADDRSFVPDMKKYLEDPRYIRIGGRPLILVYNPAQIPDCRRTFRAWRKSARELGFGEVLIWTCRISDHTAEELGITDCVDAEVQFPPHNMWAEEDRVYGLGYRGGDAFIYNYSRIVDRLERQLKEPPAPSALPLHRTCAMGWDNAARKKKGWLAYYAFSLKDLYRWVALIAEDARRTFSEEERFIFINAWNEWGEGTYLDPDARYGYANINTVSKALFSIPWKKEICFLGEQSLPAAAAQEKPPKLAVQVHMFYPETLEETIAELNGIPYPFDLYVSTDTEEKKQAIEKALSASCRAEHSFVALFPNRGRDVAPFLAQMDPVYSEYDYICHIHSKKTKTGEYGDDWRRYIFRHLFGSPDYIRCLLSRFEQDPSLGILMPETYPVLEKQAEWGGNREGVEHLLQLMGISPELPAEPEFPVGNMFWARAAAIRPLMDLHLTPSDFPPEAGQTNATLAHQIERSWVYAARAQGYTAGKVFNCFRRSPECRPLRRLGIYVHYNKDEKLSEEDFASVQSYAAFFTSLLVVSNSPLPEADRQRLKAVPGVLDVQERENRGLDFGAWKAGLLALGQEDLRGYDELILLNNSTLPPVFPISEMHAEMEARGLGFWGVTLFPHSDDGSYIGRDCIEEHLQSYYTVYTKPVFESEAFRTFWDKMPELNSYKDVVANCETQLTKRLNDAGFSYAPYIEETKYISSYLACYDIPYEKPSSLLLLGDPLVKKKTNIYAGPMEKICLEYDLRNIRNREIEDMK